MSKSSPSREINYTEIIATALTMKLTAKSTIIAQERKDFISAERSIDALKKTMSDTV